LKEALLKTKSLSEQREPNGVKKEDFDHQTVEVGLKDGGKSGLRVVLLVRFVLSID
jgi:hypothetical protein